METLAVFLLLIGASICARADCRQWTTPVETGDFSTYYDDNGNFVVAPVMTCQYPDGTLVDPGGGDSSLDSLAQVFFLEYGQYPDPGELLAFFYIMT